jgi:solute carrier family 38 (sodium-coupled neutral amino acid transporter), member 11
VIHLTSDSEKWLLIVFSNPGLPYAIKQAGFFTGLVLLVVLCFVTDWTIRLIVINAKMSGRTSYIDILHHCFGSSGRATVSLFQFAFAFGGEFALWNMWML